MVHRVSGRIMLMFQLLSYVMGCFLLLLIVSYWNKDVLFLFLLSQILLYCCCVWFLCNLIGFSLFFLASFLYLIWEFVLIIFLLPCRWYLIMMVSYLVIFLIFYYSFQSMLVICSPTLWIGNYFSCCMHTRSLSA